MTSLASSDTSLRAMARSDLRLEPMRFRGQLSWMVRDPAALRCYQLSAEEHFVFQMADGKTSLAEMKRRFEHRFKPQKLNTRELQAFVNNLQREGLLLSNTTNQGEHLMRRRDEFRRRRLLALFANPLAIRLPGINPEPILGLLIQRSQWIFSRWTLGICLFVIFSSLVLFGTRYAELKGRIFDFENFFQTGGILWLAVAICLAKVLHELAHGLTCKYFGGECQEMGVMFLVFTPCLYCNVSDTWRLPNKWHRIAVASAGMAVELFLGGVCLLIWCLTEPGFLNQLCLNVVFVCMISTFLINANPLLRFDGYFLLSDFIEIPNLQQKSTRMLSGMLRKFFFGVSASNERETGSEPGWILITYGCASILYRMLVVAGILWFCYALLKPHGLEIAAQMLVVIVIIAAIGPSGFSGARNLFDPRQRRLIRPLRTAVAICLLCGALAALLMIPVSKSIRVPVFIQTADSNKVYVTTPGMLMKSTQPGVAIGKGQPIAWLKNLDLELEISQMQSQVDQQTLHIKNLRRVQGDELQSAEQLPTAEVGLRALESRLEQLLRKRAELIVRAPKSGTVLQPPIIPPNDESDELAGWSRTPLDPRNQNCYLENGTWLCSVGDLSDHEAVAIIEQGQFSLIRLGQQVTLKFDQLPGRSLTGRVTQLSEMEIDLVPREILFSGEVPLQSDDTGTPRMSGTYYQAIIDIDAATPSLRIGARGKARIYVDARSLGSKLWRYARRTFW